MLGRLGRERILERIGDLDDNVLDRLFFVRDGILRGVIHADSEVTELAVDVLSRFTKSGEEGIVINIGLVDLICIFGLFLIGISFLGLFSLPVWIDAVRILLATFLALLLISYRLELV